MGPNQSLVKKVKITGTKNSTQKDELYSYVRQKPNRKFFFFFRVNLYLYNLANTGKQTKYKERIKNNIGEAPVITDSALSKFSAQQISQYLFNDGYFKNKVTVDTRIKRKKATVTYNVIRNIPYVIDSISYDITDTNVYKIYKNAPTETLLKEGDNYSEKKMKAEQERIYALMRNNGYYKFLRQYVTYNIDTNLQKNALNIDLRIGNPEDMPNQLYTIGDISIKINNTNIYTTKTPTKDTLKNDNFNYIDPYEQFNMKTFNKFLFVKKGDVYAQRNVDVTYNRLGELGVFKFSNISFSEDTLNKVLNTFIALTPTKQYTIRPEIEGTLNSGNLGANGSIGFSDKNAFKGAELFELGVKGGFETQRALFETRDVTLISRRQISIYSNLYFPKLIIPALQPNYRLANPRTFVSFNYGFEKREDFFFRRSVNTAYGYEWRDTRTRSHYIKLVDINIVNSALSSTLTQTLSEQGNFYLLRSFIPYFSLGSQYRYTENQQDPKRPLKDYLYFRLNLDVAGNTLHLLRNTLQLPKDTTGTYKVFNLIYYQYVRPDFDLRFYNIIDGRNTIVFRFNPGVGFAFGNSKILPYEKQFFVGGSNSLRAWRTRQLGPGSYQPVLDSLVSNNFFELDRTGDVKLEANVEYRFLILRSFLRAKLNGATFIDAGNVWYLKNDPPLPGAKLKLNKLFSDMAIGTGVGIRLDYTFFLFRFDVGLKLKDPVYAAGEDWVIERFSDKAFKEANNYSFVNYTFGIGYPF